MTTDIVDHAFCLDDIRCIKCSSELDTGFECNGCGFDMKPYVDRMPTGDVSSKGSS
jgi:hypothetical protein